MATITKSLTIESQGTYNLTFDLWSYSEWAASAGITTSYASLAALIADEKAVRQLMTVHASVDYFANCPDSTIISTVINNDLCAKWINLRDYALDTLSAKSNIKSVMDTADKYGYGEWGKIDSTTWGPLGNVPIMTANNAPYGEASANKAQSGNEAYKAFDGNKSTNWYYSQSGLTNYWLQYKFTNPVCVKSFRLYTSELRFDTITLQGSNDGSTYIDIDTTDVSSISTGTPYDETKKVNNNNYYLYYRVYTAKTVKTSQSCLINILQFYGRELKPLVPTMTANDKPKGQASASSIFSATYPAFQAFDGNINDFWASIENTNDQWVEYDFVDTVKPYHYYIKPFITVSGSSSYSKTAQVAVQGYVNNEWVNISGKTLVSNSTSTATNTTPSEIRGNITNPAEINKIRVNFGEKVGVQRDIIGIFQAYGMDYSEKEFAQGSTRKTIYDHGVLLGGALTTNVSVPSNYTSVAPTMASNAIEFRSTSSHSCVIITPLISQATDRYNIFNMVLSQGQQASNNIYGRIDLLTSKTANTSWWVNSIANVTVGSNNIINNPVTLDMTNISNNVYIAFAVVDARKCDMSELWLE